MLVIDTFWHAFHWHWYIYYTSNVTGRNYIVAISSFSVQRGPYSSLVLHILSKSVFGNIALLFIIRIPTIKWPVWFSRGTEFSKCFSFCHLVFIIFQPFLLLFYMHLLCQTFFYLTLINYIEVLTLMIYIMYSNNRQWWKRSWWKRRSLGKNKWDSMR